MMARPTNEWVNREFDRFARSYSALLDDPLKTLFAHQSLHFHRRKWLLIERLLKHAGVAVNAQRWLDVGCGEGKLLEIAGRHFAQAIGCDPSMGMLASHALFETRWQPSPVELPFGDGCFDFVTAVCVYHHVHREARARLTREIRRVLTPGGMCCVIEHNPWNPVTQVIVKRCPVDVDACLLSAPIARMVLEASGFEFLSKDYFLYFPERLFNHADAIEKVFCKIPFGGQYALLARVSAGHNLSRKA